MMIAAVKHKIRLLHARATEFIMMRRRVSYVSLEKNHTKNILPSTWLFFIKNRGIELAMALCWVVGIGGALLLISYDPNHPLLTNVSSITEQGSAPIGDQALSVLLSVCDVLRQTFGYTGFVLVGVSLVWGLKLWHSQRVGLFWVRLTTTVSALLTLSVVVGVGQWLVRENTASEPLSINYGGAFGAVAGEHVMSGLGPVFGIAMTLVIAAIGVMSVLIAMMPTEREAFSLRQAFSSSLGASVIMFQRFAVRFSLAALAVHGFVNNGMRKTLNLAKKWYDRSPQDHFDIHSTQHDINPESSTWNHDAPPLTPHHISQPFSASAVHQQSHSPDDRGKDIHRFVNPKAVGPALDPQDESSEAFQTLSHQPYPANVHHDDQNEPTQETSAIKSSRIGQARLLWAMTQKDDSPKSAHGLSHERDDLNDDNMDEQIEIDEPHVGHALPSIDEREENIVNSRGVYQEDGAGEHSSSHFNSDHVNASASTAFNDAVHVERHRTHGDRDQPDDNNHDYDHESQNNNQGYGYNGNSNHSRDHADRDVAMDGEPSFSGSMMPLPLDYPHQNFGVPPAPPMNTLRRKKGKARKYERSVSVSHRRVVSGVVASPMLHKVPPPIPSTLASEKHEKYDDAFAALNTSPFLVSNSSTSSRADDAVPQRQLPLQSFPYVAGRFNHASSQKEDALVQTVKNTLPGVSISVGSVSCDHMSVDNKSDAHARDEKRDLPQQINVAASSVPDASPQHHQQQQPVTVPRDSFMGMDDIPAPVIGKRSKPHTQQPRPSVPREQSVRLDEMSPQIASIVTASTNSDAGIVDESHRPTSVVDDSLDRIITHTDPIVTHKDSGSLPSASVSDDLHQDQTLVAPPCDTVDTALTSPPVQTTFKETNTTETNTTEINSPETSLVTKDAPQVSHEDHSLFEDNPNVQIQTTYPTTIEAPITQSPTTEAPTTEVSVAELPVAEAPLAENLVTELPMAEAQVIQSPEAFSQQGSPSVSSTALTASNPLTVAAPPVLAMTAEQDENKNFVFPPLDLLNPPSPSPVDDDSLSQKQLAELLEKTLEDFGVQSRVMNAHIGPVVTQFEVELAPGTKTSRVISLSEDIARSMSAVSVRVATITGSSLIGIELPNAKQELVNLREILLGREYIDNRLRLPMTIGKDIAGQPEIIDLARMPHLLVAGTTGSGKSVGLNAMILSLLFGKTPAECRFIMIDPKMLELSVYDGIPHMLVPVVTDPQKALLALKWAVREMEDRYRLMSKLGVRNIESFNARAQECVDSGEPVVRKIQTGFDQQTGKPVFEEETLSLEPAPYIVVIVDEFADLMMAAGKEIETYLQRLAQMARAAGIHIIMATQRPSVDVVTGTIKANFPSRISYMVSSKIDSRTIIGEPGAEQLIGRGDLLFMAAGGRLKRCHAPFVADDEVEAVCAHLRKQGEPVYNPAVLLEAQNATSANTSSEDGVSSDDALYEKAVDTVLRSGKASTSFVQRQLQIGYNRAARIVEKMEEDGIVGAANHVGRREVINKDRHQA